MDKRVCDICKKEDKEAHRYSLQLYLYEGRVKKNKYKCKYVASKTIDMCNKCANTFTRR